MKGTKHRRITTGTAMIANATGEVINFGKVDIRTERENLNSNFYMIFERAIEKTGNIMIDYLFYLMKRMASNNTVLIKDEKAAKELGVSRQTIERAKKKWKAAGALKYTAGTVFLNPGFIFKGNAYKREKRMNEYHEFRGIGDEKN